MFSVFEKKNKNAHKNQGYISKKNNFFSNKKIKNWRQNLCYIKAVFLLGLEFLVGLVVFAHQFKKNKKNGAKNLGYIFGATFST